MSFRYNVPVDSLQVGDVVADLDGQTVVEVKPYSPAPGVKQAKVITHGADPNSTHQWIVEPAGWMTVIEW